MFCMFSLVKSVACTIPNQGEEYDKLIQVKELDENNLYQLSIPRSVYKSEGSPELFLVYYTRERVDNCVEEKLPDGSQIFCEPKDQYREKLQIQGVLGDFIDFIMNKDNYVGKFIISPKEGYVVAIKVMWNSEVCLTYASKIVKE